MKTPSVRPTKPQYLNLWSVTAWGLLIVASLSAYGLSGAIIASIW